MLQKMYSENYTESQDSLSQSVYSEGLSSRKMDFQFYWRALSKNKWPITLFTSVMTAAAIFFSQLSMPVYEAKATLLLESQRANITSIEDLVGTEEDSADYYGTQLAILKSRALAERVVQQLEQQENISKDQFSELLAPSMLNQLKSRFGLGDTAANDNGSSDEPITTVTAAVVPEGAVDSSERQKVKKFNETLKHFRQAMSVNPVVKTKLITISYESTDPEFAALAANAIAAEYIASGLERRKEFKDSASAWMDGRVAELKFEMERSEDALLAFKKENGLVDLNGGVGRLNEQELLSTSAELAAVNSELSNARDMYRKIQSFKNSSPELLETLPFVQNDNLVRSVQNDLGEAQRDIFEARNRYGEKHPVIIDAQSRLKSLRTSLNGHIDRTVTTFENDFQLLNQRVASLRGKLEAGKQNIQVVGQKRITMEALEREVAVNRDQYRGLFNRIIETRTTDGLDEANALVTEAAWVPAFPIKPNKAFIVAFALFGSLLLAAVFAFLREFLDDTVISTADIERRLKTKLLGVLPLVSGGLFQGKTEKPLTPEDVTKASETYTEAVNTCRTALSVNQQRKSRGDEEFKVILVTSSIPNEGKSTVALNLAYSYGQLERTLLIDCDLRKPSIAGALGIDSNAVGLSTLLTQKPPVEDFIQRDILDSFDCLTSGPNSSQPLEMLASDKFAKILELLRLRYDKIIIDSAPTHVVSDALVLSKLADSVLYVLKPHETPIKLIHNGLSRLSEAGAPVAGVCVSQVDINKSKAVGGLEFHGFGINYQYGSHYRNIGETTKLERANLRSQEIRRI